ncbi:MAG: diguanylate cyclase [Deltaproteobacteria bacterium]|nr:diguanylate cyclase [Deltaproteobacteria bacterium]
MAAKRLAIFDPSGRLIADLAPLASQARVTLHVATATEMPAGCAALLVAPLVAGDLGPAPADGAPRWIVGDGSNAARVAGAAAQAGASGVLLTPVSVAALDAVAHSDATSPDFDLARARGLIATSLVDLTGAATETLLAVAEGFTAHDCVVWWRDGAQMVPTSARLSPDDGYRAQIAGAARIAAAAAGTVITAGPNPRSVIADALRSSPTEVSGLVAIVSDAGRRFSAAERTDLKAIAARLTRELSWLSSHRRLVAEGERLLAATLHDPLTGAMARGAFEQTIAHEAASAARRGERLTIVVIDVVGLRRINLQHKHTTGDEVLAQVASRLRATVRGNDPIGRLGGDELAVLLVGATDAQAALVVRKLIYKIQSEPIVIDDKTSLSVQVRAVASELATGERSGESAVARCYAALRAAPIGDVRIVASDERVTESDAGADAGQLSAGTVVGGTYRVVHELSRGAMGVVYRGEDLGLNRAVAIKVLRSDLASDRDLVSRFRAEAGILASLHHPNLVQVFALGEHAGDVYFVMELVEGQPLSEVLRQTLERKEWFPTAAVAQITMEIADALDAMHQLGLIHRDVKPANILLDRERDRAVLVDVGVAVKAGDQRDAAGTPGFAAPESFLEPTDAPTTDVYGLAATAYSMLTGRPPFGSGPAQQVVQRQMNDALVPPSQLRFTLSEAVDAVLAKALSPSAKRRWASASTFAIALGRALERLPPDRIDEELALADPIKTVESLLAPTSGLEQAHLVRPPNERIVTGQVRGAHLRVLSRLLQHHIGEGGMAKLVNESPRLAGALSASLAPLAWVELADLVTALESARAKVPSQLVPRKVGRNTISATFARLFGADPASVPAETVLAALPSYWPRFHAWGEVAVEVRPGIADVSLSGYAGSTDVCALVAAELERIVELTGAREVMATHTSCACTGDPRCDFQLQWSA